MKIQLDRIKVLTGIALRNLRPGAAYDDNDFRRSWKDWKLDLECRESGKTRNLIGKSRLNVFQVPKDDENHEKKAGGGDDANMFAEGFDVVTPYIVGGVVVDPPRKYKVSLSFMLLFVLSFRLCNRPPD